MRTATAVVTEPVTFPAGGDQLAANLYRPAGEPSGPAPAVFVAGTWTSVKEQMANRYAENLARRGPIALSFDFAGFGLSGGQPREVESAHLKVRDMHSAVSFLSGHPMVDANRIGALAICASAMYATRAAVEDDRIRALALVAPWLHDPTIVRHVYGGDAGIDARLRAARTATADYERTGVVEYVPVADPDDPRAAMPMAIDFYTDPTRGRLPGWPNRFAVMAWQEWLTLDAIALAPRLRVPTLMVHSKSAAIPEGAQRFYDALRCARQLIWLTGTQFDFYDQRPAVDAAVDCAATHFARHLNETSEGEAP